ncbi:zinc finger protein 664-like [Elgaria multicarinata webbii]|uniref:zinc finger protein 664-like n=1 Tax=Elgaria multicarinata webbii TaxID=159646 RepID=UPI002FCCB903
MNRDDGEEKKAEEQGPEGPRESSVSGEPENLSPCGGLEAASATLERAESRQEIHPMEEAEGHSQPRVRAIRRRKKMLSRVELQHHSQRINPQELLEDVQVSEDEGKQHRGPPPRRTRSEEVCNQPRKRKQSGKSTQGRKDESVPSVSGVSLEPGKQKRKRSRKCLDAPLRIHTGKEPSQSSEPVKSDPLSKKSMKHPRLDARGKTHKCLVCGKCFRMDSVLKIHQRIHLGGKLHNCTECGKRFTRRLDLIVHKVYHRIKKPYNCKECGENFSHKVHLTRHQRIHTGEKPYKCEQCGKSFNNKSNFRRHCRWHTGEKPYKCEQCKKSFNRKSTLTQHRMCHTGEKPYKCEQCGKSFNNKSNLKQHRMCHTGEKPYKCEQCGKCFSRRLTLKEHRRCHTGEKPYKCEECGKGFSWSSSFKSHQQNHSGKKDF